jgi:hypothetical protein
MSSSMSCGGNSVSTRPTRDSGGSLSAARVIRPWRSTAAFHCPQEVKLVGAQITVCGDEGAERGVDALFPVG